MTMRGEPLFDPLSYARRGPGRRDHLTPDQIQQIERTVRRTPEVMVKVLPKGTNSLRSVKNHMAYISRRGKVDLTTDDGDRLHGRGIPDHLITDWDLELESLRDKSALASSRSSAKLVHKVLFSMPPGTDPAKVLSATRNFCREEFGLKQRYVMALHTDEPHPHVHVIVKAMSEQGERLNIRKATLREWREGFARHLRALGIEANATQRQVRGEVTPRKTDGIYWASRRGESTHLRERTEAAARTMAAGMPVEPGKAKLVQTRQQAQRAWTLVSDLLMQQGQANLAAHVRRFAARMPPPMTEREWIAARVVEHARELRVQEPMSW